MAISDYSEPTMAPADMPLLATASAALHDGVDAVLLTVARTWGSSPRPVGSQMWINALGQVRGSVSGGCIEDELVAKVQTQGLDALVAAGTCRLLHYGVAHSDAQRVGLPCGGQLDLMAERLSATTATTPTTPASTSLVLSAPHWLPTWTHHLHQGHAVERRVNLATGQVHILVLDPLATEPTPQGLQPEALASTFVQRNAAPWRVLLVGAGQISQHVVTMAQALDFQFTVCDPRETYWHAWQAWQAGHATNNQMPPPVTLTRDMPDDAWAQLQPDSRTAAIALSHDPKLDDLLLIDALQGPAFYVAALGSVRNQQLRRQRLAEHFALSPDQLQRLHGPAGLPIGSRIPAEIALSVLAQLVAAKNSCISP